MVMPPASNEWSVWGVWRSHPLGWIWNDPEGPSPFQSSEWKYLRLQLLFLPSPTSLCPFKVLILRALSSKHPACRSLPRSVSSGNPAGDVHSHHQLLSEDEQPAGNQQGKSSCKGRIFSKFPNWWCSTGKSLSWVVEDWGSRSSSVPAHLLSLWKSPQVT